MKFSFDKENTYCKTKEVVTFTVLKYDYLNYFDSLSQFILFSC